MSWIAFALLAYVAVALQSGLTPFLRVGAAEPNFGLMAVVFVALYAQRQPALLGAFVLGALQDLATRQPFGLFAFSYGIAAMAVLSAARSVHKNHPLTHFFCVLLAAALTAVILLLRGRLHGESAAPLATFGAVLYTALLAPVVIGILQQGRRVFAFTR